MNNFSTRAAKDAGGEVLDILNERIMKLHVLSKNISIGQERREVINCLLEAAEAARDYIIAGIEAAKSAPKIWRYDG